MKITPKTEEEIKSAFCLPEGEYPFEISAAEDTVSKSGNDMIKMTVRVFKADGNFNLVTDYLLASMEYKLRHACEACGVLDKYETGVLNGADFIGKEGVLKLSIRKSDQYGDQNQIKDYVVQKDGDKKPLPKKDVKNTVAEALEGDEIPF